MHTTARTAPRRRRPGRLASAALVALAAVAVPGAPGAAFAAPATTQTPAAVLTPRAAAGKLEPQGCSGPASNVTCELWAMPGTTQLLGTSVPIWGFSTSADAGTASAPGPVLVVDQGDTVTITVHNGLNDPLSLALPGQAADGFSHGLNDVDGAAPGGGSATYTFKASRAGTFLYEAGHTPQGARQVAMGLAGALVVRDPSGQAQGNAYDDESVVVLSEIDPALNADPQHFDMREFRPGWRLINGRPFPSTSSIPTDVGHKVLLRYVNAGSQSHSMSLLGADQLQVAEDGHAMRPQREIVAALVSGATADTIVSMPSGPDSKVTLFEEGQQLNNVGQTAADPTSVATGGMMTFLDTAASPPTDDVVGPAVSHETVTPSTSDGLSDVTVSADLSDVRSGNSNVVAAELLVDDSSVGVGFGLPMQGTFGSSTAHVTGTLPAHPTSGDCNSVPTPVALECLSAGKHHLYVRGLDDASSHNWGVVSSAVLNLPKTGPATTGGTASPTPTNGVKALSVSATGDDSDADGTIDRAEMFVDTVGADGSGTALSLNRVATIVSETGSLPATPPSGSSCPTALALSCLPEGMHHVFVHSHDDLGLWGPVLDVPFTVDRTGPGVDAVALSPNPSNGLISAPGNSGSVKVTAIVTDTGSGGALQSPLAGAEGFFNPTGTPVDGKGFQLLAVDGKFDSPSENVYGLIPLSQVKTKADGSYHVYVHGKDAAGNWGDTYAVDLVVDKTAPVLASVAGSPDPTNGAALLTLTAPVTKDTSFQAATYWTGTTDVAPGKGTRVSVSYVDGKAVVSVPLAGLPLGPTRFNLRVQDMAGNWSNAVSTTVTVTKGNAIFSDNFDSGGLLAWSSRTGMTGLNTVTARPDGPAMRVNGGGTHYVTDNTPTAETTYHAQFSLDTGTLSSSATTVFDARAGNNGGGALVTSVDFRKSGAVNQVRLNLGRSNGAGTSVGTWVNLPSATTTPPTVRVDWSSGPATGANQGSARLLLDGAVVASLTGDTSTLRVESARLGLVSNGATGTAYLDSFVSTRFTLP